MNLDFVIALEKRAALLISYSRRSVENIVPFLLVRDLDMIGMHHLPSRIQHALLEIQIFEQHIF